MNIILKIKWEKEFNMFLDKYLNSTYLDLVYSNYQEDYINLLDEDNFNKVYILLKNNNAANSRNRPTTIAIPQCKIKLLLKIYRCLSLSPSP